MAIVDLSGNLGSASLYGKLLYGKGLYSRGVALTPGFAANLDVIGFVDFVGNLAPAVTFAASGPGLIAGLVGNLAPQTGFGANLSLIVGLTGILLDGGFYFTVNFAASSMISGPLWPDSEPCPPSMWTPVEPCDEVEWSEAQLCNG